MKERLARGRPPGHRDFWALRDATFAVPKGASLGIIGHNGSGKSTALKVLTGIYRPTSGNVTVNGRVAALLEVGAGFHPELTGRENIRLNGTILGFTGQEMNRMMDQIIEFADIGEFIDNPIKHYSSGMHVRLGFAVSVMVRPEILIVDEVISVGDEEFQRKCFDHMHGLRRSGTTMVLVSHSLGQVQQLCDETLWLERGEVQQIGPTRKVAQAYLERVNEIEASKAAARARRSPGRWINRNAAGRGRSV
ncbi:MAG: ABC transporter ATP-binding protein [Candidatus Nanopelagicales bacterium]